jgi:hypothetical protein
MSIVTYDAFFPEVLPYLPNCPEVAAVNAIRNTCIEFCTKTWYWQDDVDAQPGIVGVAEYDLDTPSGAKVVGVVDAWYDNNHLEPASEEAMREMFRSPDWRALTGTPRFFTFKVQGTMILTPIPDEFKQSGMTARVAYAPMRNSTGLFSEVYERYAEVIGVGARARLMSTPAQPYTNLTLVGPLKQWFDNEMSKVTAQVKQGLTRGPVRVRNQRFA